MQGLKGGHLEVLNWPEASDRCVSRPKSDVCISWGVELMRLDEYDCGNLCCDFGLCRTVQVNLPVEGNKYFMARSRVSGPS